MNPAPKAIIPREIRDRLGEEKTERRLLLQRKLLHRRIAQGFGPFALEHFLSINAFIAGAITLCGMRETGVSNFLDLRTEEHEVVLPELPTPFEGFRLMQLSDLHCDLDVRIMQRLRETMEGIPHDAVVLTGDYHNRVSRPFDRSVEEMLKLIPHLHPDRFAILGNHDFLEMVPVLEDAGLPFLMNERASIQRSGERLWICGIDDPHFFKTDDLEAARAGIPKEEITILLSHSPENWREASALGYHLQLSGHTHGGQICAPGGLPLYRNAPGCRKKHLAGSWHEGKMLGYTSRGTGAAGVAARFHCPPEITIHTLRSSPSV